MKDVELSERGRELPLSVVGKGAQVVIELHLQLGVGCQQLLICFEIGDLELEGLLVPVVADLVCADKANNSVVIDR